MNLFPYRLWDAKYRATWIKSEDLENIELNALPVYDNRYINIKAKVRAYSDKVYTNFLGMNGLEDDIECEPFTVISTDSLILYKTKYYLQVYLYNCAYKIAKKQWQTALMTIFWRLDFVNTVLRFNWYKWRSWSY